MDKDANKLLARWHSLEKGDGLQRARSTARIFWFIGLALCILAVAGVVYGLHRAIVAVAAASMGWIIAERNALRSRLAQWPILRRYIDWKRVQEDLSSDDKKV
jgi:hypothetical protein